VENQKRVAWHEYSGLQAMDNQIELELEKDCLDE
jgi:hypothetical protein